MRIELIFELICVHIITLQTRLETRRLCLPWERLNNQFCLQLNSIVRCPKGQWRVKDADIIIQHWHYAKASKNFVSRPQKQTYFGTAVERRSKNAGKNKKKKTAAGRWNLFWGACGCTAADTSERYIQNVRQLSPVMGDASDTRILRYNNISNRRNTFKISFSTLRLVVVFWHVLRELC